MARLSRLSIACIAAAAALAVAGLCMAIAQRPGGPEHEAHVTLRELSRAGEISTYECIVRKAIAADDKFLGSLLGEKKCVFSMTATIEAGIDMASFKERNVRVDADKRQIWLTLPRPVVLSVDIPYDAVTVEYLAESGLRSKFSAKERLEILQEGERRIRDSFDSDLYDEAAAATRDFFTCLLQAAGFENVYISFEGGSGR